MLAGFAPAATHAVARSLLVVDPRLLLLTHDIAQVRDSVVRRSVRTAAGVMEDEVVELQHGCISCTLRLDVLPTLARMAREYPGSDIVLALPAVIEPEAVAAACVHCVVDGTPLTDLIHVDSYVTVVEAAGFLADLVSIDDLRHRDLHAADNDRRAVADVVVRQVEFADTVVIWGSPDDDRFEAARLGALVQRLAPWASQVRIGDTATVDCRGLARQVRGTGRHNPAVPGIAGRALEGYPIGIHDPDGELGAVSMLFEACRPFHPARLHAALEDLTSEALRGRGQLWIASQPDTAIGWESAGGGIKLGCLGYWLAALPGERWTETSDLRRLAADLDWDVYYGDRRTVLAFIGLGLDHKAIRARLTGCLLSDAEIANGFDTWRELPDPFAGFFPLTDEPIE